MRQNALYTDAYVVIHSDLLDIAYNTGDFSLIRFILAHELGHHKCGHTNLWRLMLSIILKPVALDKSFTRTQNIPLMAQVLYYAEEGALSMILFIFRENTWAVVWI